MKTAVFAGLLINDNVVALDDASWVVPSHAPQSLPLDPNISSLGTKYEQALICRYKLSDCSC